MSRYALIAQQVWDGTSDHAKSGVAVLINETLIEAVCKVSDLPPAIEQIDCSNCTLLPGLIDAHVHYSPPMGPAFLGAGVTTIRDVGNDLEWILQRRTAHMEDLTLGPTIICCGHLLDGLPAYWPRMGRPHADAESLRVSIRHEVERGVDQIKLYALLDLPLLSAGIDEARRCKKWVLAHLGNVRAEDAAEAGLNEIQHLTGCEPAWKQSSTQELDALIDVVLKHEMVMTPTFVVWDRLGRVLDHSFDFDIRRRWVHPCHLSIWNHHTMRFGPSENRFRLQAAMPHLKRCLARMHERGVTIALGTDTPFPHLVPGFSVHDEMAMYVDAGIKPIDALRSATSINARVLGIESRVGRIAPAYQADLVVVEGNPLQRIEDIANVHCVVRAGRVFRLQELFKLNRAYHDTEPTDPVTLDLLTQRAKR